VGSGAGRSSWLGDANDAGTSCLFRIGNMCNLRPTLNINNNSRRRHAVYSTLSLDVITLRLTEHILLSSLSYPLNNFIPPTTMSSAHLTALRKWLVNSPPGDWVVQRIRDILIGALRQGPIPRHVAFVMDGNRRYARSRKIETIEGHNLGFEALARVRGILRGCPAPQETDKSSHRSSKFATSQVSRSSQSMPLV